MNSRLLGAVSACAIAIISQSAQAVPVSGQGTWETTLEGRDLDGNAVTFEAYYDTELKITWLADANLAASNTFGVSGINANGTMDWGTANSWIAAMNTDGGTGYQGFNDWRLPTLGPQDGTAFNYDFLIDGTSDRGYNVSAPGTVYAGSAASEMAHLFYTTLGNLAFYDPTGVESGCLNELCLSNAGPFSNLQPASYWFGLEYAPFADSIAWEFGYGNGNQYASSKLYNFSAWAVRSGDISAVPVPAAVWLFGSGLMGLLSVARHKGN